MAKTFNIPNIYKSPIVRTVKDSQKVLDPKKKELKPSVLDFGPVRFLIPRHFGFCYGVENAIDIAYRTVEQYPDHDIYLLSEMIHNPTVNEDLRRRGINFLHKTDGTELISMDEIDQDDIVIVPAFGTTVEIMEKLKEKNIDPYEFDTTCPFVEKVWRRGNQLGKKGFSLVIHGKQKHEETRATFSHSAQHSPTVVVLNPEEAQILADILTEKRPAEDFETYFRHKCTDGFDPFKDLQHFGVINQTTMLATETQEVMRILKGAAAERFGKEEAEQHFADTHDTLCYATHENQSATYALTQEGADLSLVVGGYNSSNTMHIVEILEYYFPTYHVRDALEIKSKNEIQHYDQWEKKIKTSQNWLSQPGNNGQLTIALTSGSSCPDILVDEVLQQILAYFDDTKDIDEVLKPYLDNQPAEV